MELNQESPVEKCYCSKLPQLAHELNQSLLVIHAYVKGCSERSKLNSLNQEELNHVLNAINEQVIKMGNKIHAMI